MIKIPQQVIKILIGVVIFSVVSLGVIYWISTDDEGLGAPIPSQAVQSIIDSAVIQQNAYFKSQGKFQQVPWRKQGGYSYRINEYRRGPDINGPGYVGWTLYINGEHDGVYMEKVVDFDRPSRDFTRYSIPTPKTASST